METKSKETSKQIKVEESRLMRDLRDSSLIRKEIFLMEISSMIKMVNQFLRKMPRDNGSTRATTKLRETLVLIKTVNLD